MFLGIKDFTVFLAYTLTILSTILCVVYGVMNWNKEGDVSDKEYEEEKNWTKEELEINEELSDGGDIQ